MTDWDEGDREFMMYLFSGLIAGLEAVDEAARKTVLGACGKACAQSYTAAIFREVRNGSPDFPAFLAALSTRFTGATYEQIAPQTIRVHYNTGCGCDLVNWGLVRSPLWCECSVHNLQENFQAALGVPVAVTLEASILQGAPRCAFLVSLASTPR